MSSRNYYQAEATPFLADMADSSHKDSDRDIDIAHRSESSDSPSYSGKPALFTKGPRETFQVDSLRFSYRPVDSYEGLHRFDPDFEWHLQEEKEVVRRVCLLSSWPSSFKLNHS